MNPSLKILLLFDDDLFNNPLEQFIITENSIQIDSEDATPLVTEG